MNHELRTTTTATTTNTTTTTTTANINMGRRKKNKNKKNEYSNKKKKGVQKKVNIASKTANFLFIGIELGCRDNGEQGRDHVWVRQKKKMKMK